MVKILIFAFISVAGLIGILLIFLNTPRSYRAEDLKNLKLEVRENQFQIFIPLPLESIFAPTLVESKRSGDRVFITVKKQMITPWIGLYRSLIDTNEVKESMAKADRSHFPTVGSSATVYKFDIKEPHFILSTSDGDRVLQTEDMSSVNLLSLLEAQDIAIAFLKTNGSQYEMTIRPEKTKTFSFGFVFFYAPKKFIETGDRNDQVPGNGPLVVTHSDHQAHPLTSSVDPDTAIADYIKQNNLVR